MLKCISNSQIWANHVSVNFGPDGLVLSVIYNNLASIEYRYFFYKQILRSFMFTPYSIALQSTIVWTWYIIYQITIQGQTANGLFHFFHPTMLNSCTNGISETTRLYFEYFLTSINWHYLHMCYNIHSEKILYLHR